MADEHHAAWSQLLVEMEEKAAANQGGGVSAGLLATVLKRVRIGAGETGRGVPRVDIVEGTMLKRRSRLAPASVSKATSALRSTGLLSQLAEKPGARGGMTLPLQLGRDKYVIGIHVDHRDGKLRELFGVLTRLNGEKIKELRHPLDLDSRSDPTDVKDAFVGGVCELVKQLKDSKEAKVVKATQEKLLGVGVEIGAHVRGGKIILATNARALDGLPLRDCLTEQLRCPVTVENDVNARAIQAYYDNRLHDLDFVLVEVFDGGVGGAHILDGHLYRGSGGLAPEPGHLTVEYRPTRISSHAEARQHNDDKHRSFSDPCTCESPQGHVDTLATTSRIRGELHDKELADLVKAAQSPALVPDPDNPDVIRLSDEGVIFRRAGTGLGRGLAAIINIVNPGELMLRLPTVLAVASPQSSGAQYLSAVENGVNEAFSTGPRDARNGKQRLSIEAVDDGQVAREGAFAAAATVLNGFIDHAREHDGCKIERPEQTNGRDGDTSIDWAVEPSPDASDSVPTPVGITASR